MAETSGNAAVSPANSPGGHAACDAEITRLREHVARLGREHHRHALAVTAHKARADQQESRAAAAERQLARFVRYVEEYDLLAERAAQGQRDSDVLKEIRRRIPPLERQAERCRDAEAKLSAIAARLARTPARGAYLTPEQELTEDLLDVITGKEGPQS